jgi:hypothetical protein
MNPGLNIRIMTGRASRLAKIAVRILGELSGMMAKPKTPGMKPRVFDF